MSRDDKNKVAYNPFQEYSGSLPSESLENRFFPEPKNMAEAAFLTPDKTGRLGEFMRRVRKGEKVNVLALGGSITEGSGASPGEYYIDNLRRWFDKTLPADNVNCINVGRGTTTSLFGSARVQRDLLPLSPDLVVVEYAVNDTILTDWEAKRAFEGVLRQILSLPTSPAVLVLFCCCGNFASAERFEADIVRHYGLPSSSFISGLQFEMKNAMDAESFANLTAEAAEEWTVKNYIFDGCHPNTKGYYQLTDMVISHLLLSETQPAAAYALPEPMHSDVFAGNRIYDNRHLKLTENTGWQIADRTSPYEEHGYLCNQKGATIVFDLPPCRIVTLVTRRSIRATAGVMEISLDDGEPFKLDAFFAGGWGTHNNYRVIVDEETAKSRKLSVTFTGEQSETLLSYAKEQGISPEEAGSKVIISELHLAP